MKDVQYSSGSEQVCWLVEAAVQQQGEAVRSLKEGQGLDNNADPVKEAVADLLKQKAKLESMKERFSLSLPVWPRECSIVWQTVIVHCVVLQVCCFF